MTSTTAIEAEALCIWRERKRRFSALVRRMTHDALDCEARFEPRECSHCFNLYGK